MVVWELAEVVIEFGVAEFVVSDFEVAKVVCLERMVMDKEPNHRGKNKTRWVDFEYCLLV